MFQHPPARSSTYFSPTAVPVLFLQLPCTYQPYSSTSLVSAHPASLTYLCVHLCLLQVTPCKHIFHKECLSKTTKTCCPLCRTPFDADTCMAVYEEQVDSTMRGLYNLPVEIQPTAFEATSLVTDLSSVSDEMAAMTAFMLDHMDRASFSMTMPQIGAAVQLFVDCVRHCSRFGTFTGFMVTTDGAGNIHNHSQYVATSPIYTPMQQQVQVQQVQQQVQVQDSPASPEPPAIVSPFGVAVPIGGGYNMYVAPAEQQQELPVQAEQQQVLQVQADQFMMTDDMDTVPVSIDLDQHGFDTVPAVDQGITVARALWVAA